MVSEVCRSVSIWKVGVLISSEDSLYHSAGG